ncbi:MAG: accessory factor UbiK family protein, partial [Nitratireductor sp.]
MSNGPNRILDDFAKLLTDAAGAAQGVRNEVETAFRAQAERILNSMDVVQREEFE